MSNRESQRAGKCYKRDVLIFDRPPTKRKYIGGPLTPEYVAYEQAQIAVQTQVAHERQLEEESRTEKVAQIDRDRIRDEKSDRKNETDSKRAAWSQAVSITSLAIALAGAAWIGVKFMLDSAEATRDAKSKRYLLEKRAFTLARDVHQLAEVTAVSAQIQYSFWRSRSGRTAQEIFKPNVNLLLDTMSNKTFIQRVNSDLHLLDVPLDAELMVRSGLDVGLLLVHKSALEVYQSSLLDELNPMIGSALDGTYPYDVATAFYLGSALEETHGIAVQFGLNNGFEMSAERKSALTMIAAVANSTSQLYGVRSSKLDAALQRLKEFKYSEKDGYKKDVSTISDGLSELYKGIYDHFESADLQREDEQRARKII